MNKDVFRTLRQMLMEELDLSRELSDKEILDVIDELILNQIKDVRLALKEKVQLRQELFYSVRKLDVLQELVDDETVTEIMVNGPDTIFVERAGRLTRWHKSFTSAEKLGDVIQQIVGKCNLNRDFDITYICFRIKPNQKFLFSIRKCKIPTVIS